MAVDPEKTADEGQAPEVDETSADDASAPVEPKDEGQDQAPQEPEYIKELRDNLAAAREDARQAREYARRAQGTSDATATRLEKQVARLSQTLTKALTANMDEDQRRAFERDMELERLREEKSAPPTNGDNPELREWQAYAARVLEKVGIKHDDPRLAEAFRKHNADSQNPADWQVALAAAIAEVGKGEVEKARTDAQKTADAERVKARNEARRTEGKIDRSSPSGAARARVADMTDEEFDKHWEAQKNAAAKASAGR